MSLPNTALLATLSIRMLGNARKDAHLTADVHHRHHMAEDAGRYQKCLLPDACLTPLRKIMSAARADHRAQTLITPMGHLLPASKVAHYTATFSKWKDDTWLPAVRVFKRDYPQNIELAKQKLAASFNAKDYPLEHELDALFVFDYKLLPMPNPELIDGIAGLADAQIHDLRRQLIAGTAQAAQAATDDLLQRILHRLHNLSACLSNPDSQVRHRTVESLTEMLDAAQSYNLSRDPTITRLVADCRANLTLTTESLRDNEHIRTRTAAAARVILQPYARKIAA